MRIRGVASLLLLGSSAMLLRAAEPEKAQYDWKNPKTVQAFFEFAAKKYTWPKSVTKTSCECSNTDGITFAGALIEIEPAVKDDMTRAFIVCANLFGQTMAQGAALDKVGVIFKTQDGRMGTVLMPPADLKKLGAESIKGAKADKAAINKIVGELVKKCDWAEAEKLIKPVEKPK